MHYLRIKNWDEFQHYRDRNPPWIKLHRALLDDYEFGRLPDTSKACLMLIWLLGSQSEGRIPADPKFLQARLGLEKPPNLQIIVEAGFLIVEQDASKPLQNASETLDLARSREERREEKRREEARARDDFARFWLAYPKRVSKPDAEKSWKNLAFSAEQAERVIATVERWKSSDEWTRDGGRYIQHPATWLNKRRWEEELPLEGGSAAPTAAGPRVIDLGTCPCGAPAAMKVGNRPRCREHRDGFNEEAAA